MGIKYKNVDQRSALKKTYVPVHFNSTAGAFLLSAGMYGSFMAPFDCYIEKVWLTNDVAVTGSNGIDVSVCNATTDAVPLAAAGDGHWWSASPTVIRPDMSGSLAWVANTFIKLGVTNTTMISQGCLLNCSVSATACECNIGMTVVLTPAPWVS